MASFETEGRATAEALVVAGRRLFTRHGYDAASVRAITAEAGANLGAITYHFGSKRALYDRVVESCMGPLADRVEAAAQRPGGALERVEGVVREVFGYFLANPDVPQLMLQELTVGRTPPTVAAAQIRRLHGVLAGLVVEGQGDGSVRAGNPALMAISIISHPVHLMLVRRPLQAFLAIDLEDEAVLSGVIDNAVQFATAGLAGRGKEAGR